MLQSCSKRLEMSFSGFFKCENIRKYMGYWNTFLTTSNLHTLGCNWWGRSGWSWRRAWTTRRGRTRRFARTCRKCRCGWCNGKFRSQRQTRPTRSSRNEWSGRWRWSQGLHGSTGPTWRQRRERWGLLIYKKLAIRNRGLRSRNLIWLNVS